MPIRFPRTRERAFDPRDSKALLFGMEHNPLQLAIGGIGAFARASAASGTDWEGRMHTDVLSGEMRMSGWRRVRNLIAGSDAPVTQSVTVIVGNSYQARIGAGSANGATAVFSDAFSGTLTGVAGSDISFPLGVPKTATTASVTITITGSIADLQLEDVTGQSNQNPAKYVSSSIGSPYHGVGVSAVKEFSETNGNTVDGSGVVTEAAGLPLHPQYYEPALKANVWATYKPWAASESTLSPGSRRVPSQNLFPAGGNGYWYYVSTFVGASTGATEPTWPTTIGATVVDATGNTWTNGGYYRIDGYLSEPQRTNIARMGNKPDDATYWARTDVTVTLNNAQSPDGQTNSSLITEGVAGTANLQQSSKTITAGTRQAMAAWVARGNTDWVEIGMLNAGGTAGIQAWLNTATGLLGTSAAVGTGTLEAAYVEMKGLGSHWRVVLVGKMAAADVTAQPYIHSASADGSSTRVNNATFKLYRLQHVTADSITSDIPNDGATDVTRVADSLSYPARAALATTGTALVVGREERAGIGGSPNWFSVLLGMTTGGEGPIGTNYGQPAGRFILYDGTSVPGITGTTSLRRPQVLAASWGGAVSAQAKDGAVSSGAFDGSFGAGGIYIGSAGATSTLSGAVRSAALLFTPPADSVLQAATQWHNL